MRGCRRIGLNAHLLNLRGNYRSAGINWYIYHLLQNLPVSEYEYTVFGSEPRAHEHFPQLRFAASRLPTQHPLVRIAWEQWIQPFALKRERIDLLHALAFAGPLSISIPWIVTVYDLSFVRFPDSFNRANRTYLRWAVGHAVRHASRVIAISESTKRDLVSMFGIPAQRVAVVYCGVEESFVQARPRAEMDSWRARRGSPDRYVLHVGTLEPRKNIATLLRAFAHAKRIAPLPHQLVLVGARGWKHDEIDRVIAELGLADSVVFTGYVPPDELTYWYRAADLLAYPSWYEGFGLPPLEAMASGVPVVTSNAASLPEVVGDAALLVSPEDERGLAQAMVRVLTDRALREEMIARGVRQANKFSWKRAALETAQIYTSVFAERRTETAHATA